MSLQKSEAVILKAFNWSESSRTVVFFSKDFGSIALVDKGGRSIKSKRGRLIPFSRLELTFYNSQKESHGYISDVELLESYSLENEGSLGRLAYASAACELLKFLLPEEEPQPQLYIYFINYLRLVEKTDKKYLPALFIAFYLRLLSHLGYHPSLAYCATCGKDLKNTISDTTEIKFGYNQGGVICSSCQKAGDYYIGFSGRSYKLILALQTASLAEAGTLPLGYTDASGILEALTKFLSGQTGLKADLKSLDFINKLKNNQKTG